MVDEGKDKKGKGSGTKDACYHKVKSRYSVWPSAYASGALVKCRKVGAANWGNSTKKEEFELGESKKDKLKEISKQLAGASKMHAQQSKKVASVADAIEEAKKCWPGYEKKGMKTMFGKRYPNCVKKKTRKEEVELEEGAFKNQYGKKGKLAQSSKRKSLGRGATINPDAKDTGYESPAEFRTAEKRLSSYKEEVELDEVTRREISLTGDEDKKFKALLDKVRKSKKKPDSNYRPEGGPVRTSKIESDYYARKKKFFSKEELELEEAKEAKSCPAGKYWCYDSKKCKTIPTGWYVGRGGYLEKEEETKKKNGNGNGDHDSNGGSDGGGSNGGGNGGGGE